MNLYNFLQLHRAPKLDLHVHLQGSGNLHVISYLISKNRNAVCAQLKKDRQLYERLIRYPAIRHFLRTKQITIEEGSSLFQYESIEQFFATYKFLGLFIRSVSDLELYIRGFLIKLGWQNVLFADVIVSLPELVMQGLEIRDVLLLLEKYANVGNIQINWWIDLVRHKGVQSALSMLWMVIENDIHHIVTGINLGGDERAFNLSVFEEVFDIAIEHELSVNLHDGETQIVNNHSKYNKYGVRRIAHGLDYIRKGTLPDMWIEVCLSSNYKTRVIDAIYSHPIFDRSDNLTNIIICSDDATLFSTSLAKELQYVLTIYGKNGLIRVINNALNCANEKTAKEIIEWYNENIEET